MSGPNDDAKQGEPKAEEKPRPILELLPPLAPRPKRPFPRWEKLEEFVTAEEDPGGIVYQHSVLCQTFLPYRDPGLSARAWERSNGFLNLKVVAGDAIDPRTGDFMAVGLPFGPKARLVLYHLNAEALRTRCPEIELAASLTKFVRHTLALSSNGRTIATVREQLTRVAAADFRVLMRKGDEAHLLKGTFVERLRLWAPADGRARDRTPTSVTLSRPYFESLLSRAVPLNESAMWQLSHNAMAMDLYAWLAQRLHRIDPEHGEVLVPWARLREQFGAGYQELWKFRQVFKPTLEQVIRFYPQGKVALDARGLALRHSRPPVGKRRLLITTPE